jgi:hypothetical protein
MISGIRPAGYSTGPVLRRENPFAAYRCISLKFSSLRPTSSLTVASEHYDSVLSRQITLHKSKLRTDIARFPR